MSNDLKIYFEVREIVSTYVPKFEIVSKSFKNGTSTNGGPTNVGRYKHKTYKRRTVQTSDQYKRQTSTNIGPVQTSDWYKRGTSTNVRPVQTSDQYKRRTGTNVGPVQTSDGYIYKEKRRTKKEKIYLNFQIEILVNSQFSLKKIPNFFVKNS